MKSDTVSASEQREQPSGHDGLARHAPGQVRAAFFGAMKWAFVVAFRIANLVRDLFAEGAMSAAFVPTFTKPLTLSFASTS
jgi:hypothetical protein